MLRRPLIRRPWTSTARNVRESFQLTSQSRRIGSKSPGSSSPSPSQSQRAERILRKCPKFLRPTISALFQAPVTHVTAFLLLHEVTAIVPLFGLVGAFHYFHWLPPYFAEGAWVLTGVEKFGNYFRRKGWIDADEQKDAELLAANGEAERAEQAGKSRGRVTKWWGRGEAGTRVVIEFATAYALVKLLLPLRLVLSAWGAPWFARWTVIPISNIVKQTFRKKPK